MFNDGWLSAIFELPDCFSDFFFYTLNFLLIFGVTVLRILDLRRSNHSFLFNFGTERIRVEHLFGHPPRRSTIIFNIETDWESS